MYSRLLFIIDIDFRVHGLGFSWLLDMLFRTWGGTSDRHLGLATGRQSPMMSTHTCVFTHMQCTRDVHVLVSRRFFKCRGGNLPAMSFLKSHSLIVRGSKPKAREYLQLFGKEACLRNLISKPLR